MADSMKSAFDEAGYSPPKEDKRVEDRPFFDAIYLPLEEAAEIQKAFPSAIIKDESDWIHEHRFSVSGVDKDEFYPWAILRGYFKYCLGLRLMADMHPEEVEKYIAKAKAMKAARAKD